eukprot:scaffold21581_cov101-Isochrysis_galbana.AAC.6
MGIGAHTPIEHRARACGRSTVFWIAVRGWIELVLGASARLGRERTTKRPRTEDRTYHRPQAKKIKIKRLEPLLFTCHIEYCLHDRQEIRSDNQHSTATTTTTTTTRLQHYRSY